MSVDKTPPTHFTRNDSGVIKLETVQKSKNTEYKGCWLMPDTIHGALSLAFLDTEASGAILVRPLYKMTQASQLLQLWYCGVPLSLGVHKSTEWLYVGLGDFP